MSPNQQENKSKMTSFLHDAIENEDINALKNLLESHRVNLNVFFEPAVSTAHAYMTPLALATALNNLSAVKLLIAYGAAINGTFGSLNTTVLMTSSFHGYSHIVHHLLSEGADVKLVDNQGSTALGYAFGGSRSINVIHQLLEAGVDVNQPNLFGMTALLLVAGYGNDELVEMVLSYSANSDVANNFGHTALHLAVVGKRTQMKKLFPQALNGSMYYNLNRRDIDVALTDWVNQHQHVLTPNDGYEADLKRVGQFMMWIGSALGGNGHAAEDNDQSAMKRRVEAVWKYRQEKMQQEKSKLKKSGLDKLLSCGGKRAKQSARMQDFAQLPVSRPPPVVAVSDTEDSNTDINSLIDRYTRILHLLIDAGCDIDRMENTFGLTALDMSILLGDIESTAVLVASGGDDRHLMRTFALSELFDSIVSVDKKLVKQLLAYDVDLDVNQAFCEFNESQKSPPTDVQQYRYQGLTPLALAAQISSLEIFDIIKLLQKHGADINKIGPGGSSPLAEATRTGTLKMVEFLLKEGVQLELTNPAYDDLTALGVAVEEQHLTVVDFLLAHGAKVDSCSDDGRPTLLVKAVQLENEMLITRLLSASLQNNFCGESGQMYELADSYQRNIVTVNDVIRRMATTSAQEDVSLMLFGADVPFSPSTPGELSSNQTTTHRVRKKRIAKQNITMDTSYQTDVTMDTSYQAGVAAALTDDALQDTLDLSRISFQSPSANHADGQRLAYFDANDSAYSWKRIPNTGLTGAPDELAQRPARTRRRKDANETDLQRALL